MKIRNRNELVPTLKAFIRAWDKCRYTDEGESIDFLISWYKKFLSVHALPEMSAEELIVEINEGRA